MPPAARAAAAPSSRPATGSSPASPAAARALPAAWSASSELTYAGNHGLEVLQPGDAAPTLDPALGHRGSGGRLVRLAAGLGGISTAAGCGSRTRGRSRRSTGAGPPTLSWRERRAEEIAALAAEQGLVPHFGRMVLELRPLATVDKGIAVRRLVGESGVRRGALRRRRPHRPRRLRRAARAGARRHARRRRVRRRRLRGGAGGDPLAGGPGRRRAGRVPRPPAGPLMLFATCCGSRRYSSPASRPRSGRSSVVVANQDADEARAHRRRRLVADRRRRRHRARPPGAGGGVDRDGCSQARARRPTCPAETPGRIAFMRLWPIGAFALLVGGAGWFWPQVAAIGAGYAILIALAWRGRERAVTAIEDARRGPLLRRALLRLRARPAAPHPGPLPRPRPDREATPAAARSRPARATPRRARAPPAAR